MAAPKSADERVARIVVARVFGEAKQMAAIRGTPAGLRTATPEEELRLFNEWDEKVDPMAVMQERMGFHLQAGLQPEDAYVEAVLDTCAAGFKNRLKMSAGGGRLTLSEQTSYLEKTAERARKARETAQPPPEIGMEMPDQTVAPDLLMDGGAFLPQEA